MRARRITRGSAGGVALLAVALSLWAPSAGAFASHAFVKAFGSFGSPLSVAVDQGSGDVYVFDASEEGRLYKFDANGEPLEFQAPKSMVLTGVGVPPNSGESQIAVDSSSGSTKGDIYVANGTVVKIYGSEGQALSELDGEGSGPWGTPCGVAVAPDGHVYVGLAPGLVDQYVPSANPVTNADYSSSLYGLSGVCNVAAGTAGAVYVTTEGGVQKYDATQFNTEELAATGTFAGSYGRTLAFDQADGSLYVDNEFSVEKLDPSAHLVDSFGNFGYNGWGVAIDDATETIYANTPAGRTEMWGPATLPDVTTGGVSPESAGMFKLEGTVNPGGVPVTGCEFHIGFEMLPCEALPGAGNTPVTVDAQVRLVPNEMYSYQLEAVNANGTHSGEGRQYTTPAVLPVLGDSPAPVGGITRSSAVLSTVVNPEHSLTSARFVYGTTEAYGQETQPVVVGEALAAQAFPKKVEGLRPGTTYHFAAVATNPAGTVTSHDYTFTTEPATPPTISNLHIGELAPGAATISVDVGSSGLPTVYTIELGTDTGYGTQSTGEIDGLGQTISMTLLYLRPSTTYHYKVMVTNQDGTSSSGDQTFTTPAYPILVPQILPQIATPSIAFPVEKVATKVKPKHKTAKHHKPKHKSKKHKSKKKK